MNKCSLKIHSNAPKDFVSFQKEAFIFKCHCGKEFKHKRYLNAHKKRTHQASSLQTIKSKKCPLCSWENQSNDELYKHFKLVHNIPISIVNLEFLTIDEFEQWKSVFEKKTKSKFVKKRGVILKKLDNQQIYYYCHRSGTFSSKSKGLRNIKIQGTNKINGLCPAKITVLLNKNGNCKVTLIETHVGHSENDLEHLSLTEAERKSISVKIATNTPFSTILEEVRDYSTSRLHLLTKKDLYNITAAFNLKSSAVRHKDDAEDDATSVQAWVNEMREDTNDDQDDLVIHCNTKHSESGDLMKSETTNSRKSEMEFKKEKEKLKRHLNTIIDKLSNTSELKAFKDLVGSFKPTISAVSKTSTLATISTMKNLTPAVKKK